MLRTFLDLQSSLRGASLIFSKGLRLQQHDLVARAERIAQVGPSKLFRDSQERQS